MITNLLRFRPFSRQPHHAAQAASATPLQRAGLRSKIRFSITIKMFLAVLIACLLISMTMGYAVRISFENGFVHYVRERDARRVKALVTRIESAYAVKGSWDFLRLHPEEWNAILDAAREDVQRHDALPAETEKAPGWQHFPGSGRMQQFFGSFSGESSPAPQWGMRPPRRTGIEGTTPSVSGENAYFLPEPPPMDANAPRPPATIFDANKQIVVSSGGHFGRHTPMVPLHFHGQLIGWLSASGPDSISDAADIAFQAQQARATLQIAGIAVILAALVALLLARVVLAPVKRLMSATHRLANGDFTTRVPAGRRDELDQLAGDFNALADSLQKAERSRRDFIADISHELRTPLAVLRSELEAIEDGIHAFDHDSVVSLQAEVRSLNAIIEDLYELSLSDVGALRYHKERVDISPIAVAAVDAYRETFRAKNLRLSLRLPMTSPFIVDIDPGRFNQLLKNLLQNALRYTDPNGEVQITIGEHPEGWRMDIQDSAPGVPAASLPHLFERLYRVDESRSRQSGGSGLGLALCRAIVDAHGGSIDATASPLGGLWIIALFPFNATRPVVPVSGADHVTALPAAPVLS